MNADKNNYGVSIRPCLLERSALICAISGEVLDFCRFAANRLSIHAHGRTLLPRKLAVRRASRPHRL